MYLFLAIPTTTGWVRTQDGKFCIFTLAILICQTEWLLASFILSQCDELYPVTSSERLESTTHKSNHVFVHRKQPSCQLGHGHAKPKTGILVSMALISWTRFHKPNHRPDLNQYWTRQNGHSMHYFNGRLPYLIWYPFASFKVILSFWFNTAQGDWGNRLENTINLWHEGVLCRTDMNSFS